MAHPAPFRKQLRSFKARQQGIALIVVMVVLLLSTVVVITATRTNWLNETVVGSESDYQRAYAAAEALIRDAETDIRGIRPGGGALNAGNPLFFEGSGRLVGQPIFPFDHTDLDATIGAFNTLGLALPAPVGTPPCRQGICIPATEQGLGAAWWNNPATVAAMLPLGATYGQYTRVDPLAVRNPLLIDTPNRQARYWVEIFQYTPQPTDGATRMPLPDTSKQPFFFRITAFVQGQKPGTRVVLRTVFVPRPSNV